MQPTESHIYMDKYPGKVCCFCNLGERSALGQGEFIRLARSIRSSDGSAGDSVIEKRHKTNELEKNQNVCKNIKNKSKLQPNMEYINEIQRVGHPDTLSVQSIFEDDYLYFHRMCAMWSVGAEITNLSVVESVIISSLKQKCSFCEQYGAGITCRMACQKSYHLPCAYASQSLLVLQKFLIFCTDHINNATSICNETHLTCRCCSALGDVQTLVMCSTCGDHYHNTCIGLSSIPEVRCGWNCLPCSKCLICKKEDLNDGRSIKCEQCQKSYHMNCLRPTITSIPKYGWKCYLCRLCTDCGSRTPGAGNSSRWHNHYTVCDSCYQQRNKGFSCPICHKAYRTTGQKEMVKCHYCNRFVHSSCDEEADLTNYHKKKENNPDYDYICPQCKIAAPIEKIKIEPGCFTKESTSTLPLMLKHLDNTEGENLEKPVVLKNIFAEETVKITKKRINLKDVPRNRSGKNILQKNVLSHLGRKRPARKNRHLLTNADVAHNDRTARTNDDDVEKKMILCSAKDKFILSQEICVMCGSIGVDQESYLISCVQCGQCFHPYCVNIKINKIILKKGWRCLDCTICEGCGQKNDEARLILCDECDISFHIYCMSPPLETVPHGNWKCNWCAVCQKCGQKITKDKNSLWRNAYTCDSCASQMECSICMQTYNDNDLIIQCKNCERWLHCLCDSITTKEEAQLYDTIKYECILCRSAMQPFANNVLIKTEIFPKSADCLDSQNNIGHANNLNKNFNSDACNETYDIHVKSHASLSNFPNNDDNKNVKNSNAKHLHGTDDNDEAAHMVDGVFVSDQGLQMIKALTCEKKRKRDSNTNGDNAEDNDKSKLKNRPELYKDGMIWADHNNSPPDGFSISMNEEGVNILRKKRQRNLQKLGVGGFIVRNRAFKRDCEENDIAFENGDVEKKKKLVRKKLKTKITEMYPVYLQEAFFGKTLLTGQKPAIALGESESSDEMEFDKFSPPGQNISTDAVDFPNCSSTANISLPVSNTNSEHFSNSDINLVRAKPLAAEPVTYNMELPDEKSAYTKSNEWFPAAPSTIPGELTQELSSKNYGFRDVNLDLGNHMQQKMVYKNVQDISIKADGQQNNLSAFKNVIQENTQKYLLSHSREAIKFPGHGPNAYNNIKKACNSEKSFVVAFGGSQKTAEKMRRDEDLGEMATISAVLYANTQCPDLKVIYANWNDRCKQILKRWRSLSTEQKTPFLQQAKDNRSALRLRKQHNQDKSFAYQDDNADQEKSSNTLDFSFKDSEFLSDSTFQ